MKIHNDRGGLNGWVIAAIILVVFTVLQLQHVITLITQGCWVC